MPRQTHELAHMPGNFLIVSRQNPIPNKSIFCFSLYWALVLPPSKTNLCPLGQILTPPVWVLSAINYNHQFEISTPGIIGRVEDSLRGVSDQILSGFPTRRRKLLKGGFCGRSRRSLGWVPHGEPAPRPTIRL